MAVSAFARSTSVAQGGSLDFSVSDAAAVTVLQVPTGTQVFNGSAPSGVWSLQVQPTWASSLYKAVFDPGGAEAYFVVRAANPGASARVVVALPFATWQAYNLAGQPGQSLYWNEQPDRAVRVSFDRPTAVNLEWEQGLLNWLPGSGFAVEYCSGLDLHDGLDLLSRYQLLVCIGHDEYWSKEMRDAAEAFAERGGNIAFFSGNTCWWQVRFEDGMRTMVCFRDGTQDPLAGVDDSRVTVEWSSAPVNRPENGLTGLSTRRGAGSWLGCELQNPPYTCRFARHWVFEGTGLQDGASFAAGAVGYETDAAELEEVDGVPRITGRDGTPPSFVILGTADLSPWRKCGAGGMATMGVFRKGGGTIFNAGTTGWGKKLDDATVARITRNVLGRLSQRYPADQWEIIGHANFVTAMAACENRLWAAESQQNSLWVREPVGQNLLWHRVGPANKVIAMASPREAMDNRSIGLYAVADGALSFRDPIPNADWTRVADANGIVALAASYQGLFAATAANRLVYMPFSDLGGPAPSWKPVGQANDVVAMTNLNGRLFAVDKNNRLWMRPPVLAEVNWTDIGPAALGAATLVTGLAGYAGKLFASTNENVLWWRDAVARPG